MLEKEADLCNCPKPEELTAPWNWLLPVLFNSADNIHRLQKELVQKELSIDDIVNANDIIIPAEKAAEVIAERNFTYDPAKHAAAKAVDAGNKLDKIILEKIKELKIEFDKKYEMAAEKENITKASRSEFFGYLQDFRKLKEIFISRSLPAESIKSADFSFSEYARKLDKAQKLEKEIEQLVEEYRSMNDLPELDNFFKHLKKRARNFLFFKGELVSECIDADYFEGIQEIDKLKKEIKQVRKDFSYHVKTKNNILEEMAQLEKYSSAVNAGKNRDLSADDLKTIADIKERLGKFDSSYAVKTIYLGELFKQYKSASNKLYEEASDLLRNESNKLEKTYEQIEEDCAKLLATSDIKLYAPQAKKLNNELSELQVKFGIFGNKIGYENANSLIRENETRMNELEAQLKAELEIRETREEQDNYLRKLSAEKELKQMEIKQAEIESNREKILAESRKHQLDGKLMETKLTLRESEEKGLYLKRRLIKQHILSRPIEPPQYNNPNERDTYSLIKKNILSRPIELPKKTKPNIIANNIAPKEDNYHPAQVGEKAALAY